MRHAPGMNTYHGQAKDRRNWKASIKYRSKLIETIESYGVKLDNPHAMKIRDLEALAFKHLGSKHVDRD